MGETILGSADMRETQMRERLEKVAVILRDENVLAAAVEVTDLMSEEITASFETLLELGGRSVDEYLNQ